MYAGRQMHLLIRFASRDFARQVLLFVVQVLQLEMQTIDLLAGFSCGVLGVADSKNGVAVLATELSKEGEEDFLLLGDC